MKKGAIFSEEHKENLRKSHLGQKAWNKGLKGKQDWMNFSGLKPHKKGEYKHSDDAKNKMSIARKGKRLPKETREKMKESARRGSLNNKWKGGVTSENQKIRDSVEYKEWRLDVFSRDNYTCQKCLVRGGSLEAHHIENFKTHPSLRTKTSNGITFCKKCHKLFHILYGIKNTVEQLTDFIK